MSKTPFFKYTGNGNDFLIVEEQDFNWNEEQMAKYCHRQFGIGADGVIVVGSPVGLDASMRIFNSDGREAEMCGNGLRCLAHYLYDHKFKKSVYKIKTIKSEFNVFQENGLFKIEMSQKEERDLYDLSSFKDFPKSFYINTGVPHLCFIVDDAKSIDIKKTAPYYRFHPIFKNGANVNFIQVLDAKKQLAYVRTYERGVEDETFSCGTGVTASAHALNAYFQWIGDIQILNKGGEHLVHLGKEVMFSGKEEFIFKGEV